MIPKFDVKMFQRVDLSKVGMPGDDLLGLTEEDCGIKPLGINENYTDWRGGVSWEEVKEKILHERALLNGIDARTTTKEEFEELSMLVEGNEVRVSDKYDGDEVFFDLGVTAITFAISSLHGAPITSCNGLGSNGIFPTVAFYVPRNIGNLLAPHCKKTGCGIENELLLPPDEELDKQLGMVMGSEKEGFEIWAPTVIHLINLAESFYDDFHNRDDYLAQLAQDDTR